jgi:hypothetical protein
LLALSADGSMLAFTTSSQRITRSTGRFLLVQPVDGGQSARVLRVVLNWTRLLREP